MVVIADYTHLSLFLVTYRYLPIFIAAYQVYNEYIERKGPDDDPALVQQVNNPKR